MSGGVPSANIRCLACQKPFESGDLSVSLTLARVQNPRADDNISTVLTTGLHCSACAFHLIAKHAVEDVTNALKRAVRPFTRDEPPK